MAINDDSWLEQLTMVILERINYFSDDEEEKVCLCMRLGLRVARWPGEGSVRGGHCRDKVLEEGQTLRAEHTGVCRIEGWGGHTGAAVKW